MTDYDTALIHGINLKDRKSFEALYKRHYRKLYMLGYRYLGDQERTEEIVHDVFLRLWNNPLQINIKQSVTSYLSRCIINSALNTIKKEKRMTNHFEAYTADFEEAEEDHDEATLLEDKLVLLEKAIESLPPQCKKVLMMSKFDKCKQQEIADSLNISIKTVKNHLTNAYEKIRGLIPKGELLIIVIALLNCSIGLIYLSGVLLAGW
ncbi:RNA polymerase sigma-70 factor (ECF subfamily) [Pedobacter psychrotolerans]|uniref:DNA-directed RNA polymerase sigma-70 factor n=1 Tax=Pedobacter psychrotolerans TaxID=1843235 RepID=A0A4R2HHY7_9SPHI|nr:RNA polymerase sigma-70 factor [Pedobacter psychrotolerans]TCO28874.1 RNA polymerase sigma-70 factor (ECF subfamily) [Pedobacter psychrotolerans]GGE52502.1 DNA-directed RNA polymerase sigma-70 factor [Pedobacter psychrotolerans]